MVRCFLVYTGLILPTLYLLVYLSRNAIMFPSFALLSGIALFSSAAAAATLEIQVGGGLKFDPSFIVRLPTSHYVRCSADRLSFRSRRRETSFCLTSLPKTTL